MAIGLLDGATRPVVEGCRWFKLAYHVQTDIVVMQEPNIPGRIEIVMIRIEMDVVVHVGCSDLIRDAGHMHCKPHGHLIHVNLLPDLP
ncbi:hypothetical protein WK03_16970 [Burkholderia cepacia]|nr:hypothetical protein WK03_16970 [Burkholderia cepacia]